MMTDVRVRLYAGVDGKHSLVGITARHEVDDLTVNSTLNQYLKRHSQTIEKINVPEHLGHLAGDYYRVQPPLEESQIRHFAQLCLSIVSNGNHSAFCIDNRQGIPERPLQQAGDLLDWAG